MLFSILIASACTSDQGTNAETTSGSATTGEPGTSTGSTGEATTAPTNDTTMAPTTGTGVPTTTDPTTGSSAESTSTSDDTTGAAVETTGAESTSAAGETTGAAESTGAGTTGADETTGSGESTGGDPLLPHLVGYWPFNGDSEDHSGVNIDLNLVGDPEYLGSAAPGLGTSISLDGDDGAIGTNFVKFAGDDATIVAWVQADSVMKTWNTIVKNWGSSQNGQFHFGLGTNQNETVQSITAPTTVTAPLPIATGVWVFTAVVYDSVAGEHVLYINGVEVATAPYVPPLAPGMATGLGIGVKPNNDGSGVANQSEVGYWIGRIDEVGMYDIALTPADVLGLYMNGVGGIQLDGTSE